MPGLKVFSDLHHADLYYSLQLLFEKRLDAELYRPIGMEWQQQGFWRVFDHPATAQQFLGLNQAIVKPTDVHGNYLSEFQQLNLNYRFEDGIYYVYDPVHEKVQRAITLDKFKEMEFDIIISSLPQHIGPFNKLISLYQPRAKHIFQVGNAWGHLPGVTNILSSTAPFPVPPNINICFYHQEFDLEVYKFTEPKNPKIINSYIHLMRELDLLQLYKILLPDYVFTTYGASMDQVANGTQMVADKMSESGWTWHVKPEGDGFGHVIHSTYACGRPAIIKANYYRGKAAEHLLEDLVTCIDISKRSPVENAEIIKSMSQPDAHRQMCHNAYNRFKQMVDFDQEEQRIRHFLSNLR